MMKPKYLVVLSAVAVTVCGMAASTRFSFDYMTMALVGCVIYNLYMLHKNLKKI